MARWTVAELMEVLSEFPEDAEVVLAVQPSWPFEHRVGDVVFVPEEEKDFQDVEWGDEQGDGKVYIGEGGQKGYLDGEARDGLGW